jgi:hypothetical protein
VSFVIYAIADPRSRKVFFIGHTLRLDRHIEARRAEPTICGD